MNRLSAESSPYLLQHAHNPVDWWPWSDEAFAAARQRNIPVFLSIGYSTCYWCHVMERESFENPAIAALLNEKFVAIKVDREERPDVDDLYMAATVISNGHGGWPLSIFIDPATRRPFWCGTYFPPSPSPLARERPTFPQVLTALSEAFKTQASAVKEQSEAIAAAVVEQLSVTQPAAALDAPTVTNAVHSLLRMFDRNHGGFSGAPKFPQPILLLFLLDVRDATEDEPTRQAIDAALRRTLDGMMIGGISDHVAGGFHRYSVDAHWTVPHFEKMLYDNAMLISVYARAAAAFGDPQYERVVRRALAWLDREMRTDNGLFAAALDAEVDGREGASLVWMPAEVKAATGDLNEFALVAYGLDRAPNFRDPHHPHEPASYVLRLSGRPDEMSGSMGLSAAGFVEKLDAVNDRLLAFRNERPRPRRDGKAIASWNGMMLVALADAAESLGDDAICRRALELATAIESGLLAPGGAILRSVTMIDSRPVAGPAAGLEDYAWISLGFSRTAAIHKGATATHLRALADACLRQIDARFRDPQTGELFDVESGRTDLFVRPKSTHDGATPCGTSVALLAMLEAATAPGGEARRESAMRALISISGAVADSPVGCANSLRSLLRIVAESSTDAERLAGAGPPMARATGVAESSSVVQILCADDTVIVPLDTPVSLTLRVMVAEGWHIAAAEAAAASAFHIDVSGGRGVRVFADYPAGVLGLAGVAAGDRGYAGSFDIPVVLERHGEWSGTPLLTVEFQACNDTVCLARSTLELDIAIERA